MKIAFYPSLNVENESLIKVAEALKTAYPNLIIDNFPSLKSINKDNFNYDAIWLNWFENIWFSPKDLFKELRTKIKIIKLCKKKNIKIYTFFHNIKPHESRFPFLNLLFYKYLLNNATKILIHSEGSKIYIKNLIGEKGINKITKISHPAYNISFKKTAYSSQQQFTALFFGVLRPYKNIELIFKLAETHKNITFLIAGKPISDKYGLLLKEKAKELSNVKLHLGFQTDENILSLISDSNIILLPYNISSSLNSGVLYYSFSKGINVIIPKIASVDEFKNKEFIYYYTYKNKKDHFAVLSQTLERAFSDFTSNRQEFESKVLVLQNEVSENNVNFLADQIKSANLFDF